jgi:NTE family protein
LLAVLLAGCASHPINPPITAVDKTSGYRGPDPTSANNDLSRCSSWPSGGGTRAAAWLWRAGAAPHQYHGRGQTRRLLDEWTSSPAFPAAASRPGLCLYGDRLFDEYEARFLKRNVQGALTKRSFLYPSNWFRLMSGNYGAPNRRRVL